MCWNFAVYLSWLAWLSALGLFLCKQCSPWLDNLTSFGKVHHATLRESRPPYSILLLTSRAVFTSAYIFGCFWNLTILCFIIITTTNLGSYLDGSAPSLLQSFWFVLAHFPFIVMFQLHLMRRAYECLFVHRFTYRRLSDANALFGECVHPSSSFPPPPARSKCWMHPSIAISVHRISVGLLCIRLFGALGWVWCQPLRIRHTAIIIISAVHGNAVVCLCKVQITSLSLSQKEFLQICCFNSFSKHQHQCHKILANLRQDNNNNSKKKNDDDDEGHDNDDNKRTQSAHFGIPKGDWFCFVSSPHYLAEMLIYVSFILMTAGANVSLW